MERKGNSLWNGTKALFYEPKLKTLKLKKREREKKNALKGDDRTRAECGRRLGRPVGPIHAIFSV